MTLSAPVLPPLGKFPKRALLTGAGFTKNWGGHLASEVWALLASTECVRETPALRRILDGTVGAFEDTLDQVRSSRLASDTVRRFEDEIRRVFLDQEHRINDAVRLSRPRDLGELLSLFGRGPSAPPNLVPGCDSGYLFTLNQDVFVERITFKGPGQRPVTPGVVALTTESRLSGDQWHPQANPKHLDETRRIGGDLSTVQFTGNLNYIKLHGSYEWRASDGRNALVVGGGKVETLRSFPLLAMYLDLFKRICSEPELRLMVIGYGFGDSHVNEIIASGVRDNGLKVFLIDPTDPKATLGKLRRDRCPFGGDIATGIDGWSTQPLTETLRGASGRSPEYRRVLRDFFGITLPA